MEMEHYILFPNHTAGMELYHMLKKSGIKAIMAPTPRSLSASCGLSLLVREEDLDQIRQLIEENEMKIIDIAAVKCRA
jgi:hypothetical protein